MHIKYVVDYLLGGICTTTAALRIVPTLLNTYSLLSLLLVNVNFLYIYCPRLYWNDL